MRRTARTILQKFFQCGYRRIVQDLDQICKLGIPKFYSHLIFSLQNCVVADQMTQGDKVLLWQLVYHNPAWLLYVLLDTSLGSVRPPRMHRAVQSHLCCSGMLRMKGDRSRCLVWLIEQMVDWPRDWFPPLSRDTRVVW